ncbi:MAG TPA: glycosyltransferase [Pseudomonas sp.]
MLYFILTCVVAVLAYCSWRTAHRPHKKSLLPPDWPEEIHGFTYSPFRSGQSSRKNAFPTKQQIREDLEIISRFTKRIRIYSVEGSLRYIPELALECGLEVTLGAWISKNKTRNEKEVALCIELANAIPSVTHVIIGNEALYRNDISALRMLDYLDHVRRQVNVPVSTSEQWHMWTDFPELADHVDFIAAHVLAFWENIPVMDASDFVVKKAAELHRLFPRKPLLLSEVGWPSKSAVRRQGRSSQSDQSIYLRYQLQALNRQGCHYFVVEAFDQWWKTNEGVSGPRWGVFNTQRQPKVTFAGPIYEHFCWQKYISRLIRAANPSAAPIKHLSPAIVTLHGALIWAGFQYSRDLPLLLCLCMAFIWATAVLAIVVIESHEFIEAACPPQEPRSFFPSKDTSAYRPKVSIHVPCYNEPSDMVNNTLTALSELNYEHFEVLVIDNNTKDPATWVPIKTHCEKLGERFRFFHVDRLGGYKAGALNYLLPKTSKDAHIIAVIDADYRVNRNWLKHTVPLFSSSKIAVVQAPQDYRDHKRNAFKKFCYSEYRAFFNIGMVIRNDHDAIIQHGTMTLIRKAVIEELKWAEWCICEDAELGLRVLDHGYSMAYIRDSYGKGLIPDTFTDFKKQRFRWAYGAVQIMKHHRRSLIMGSRTQLSAAQRYYFLVGWLPWIALGINLVLTMGAIVWSFLMVAEPQLFDPPPWIFSTAPMLALFVVAAKTVYLYDRLVTNDIKDAFAAILAGTALYYTIGKAVLYGTVTSGIPFFRTPKHADTPGLWVAVSQAREELLTLLLLWVAAIGIYCGRDVSDHDIGGWITMLLVQSLRYLASIVMALRSSNRQSMLDTGE